MKRTLLLFSGIVLFSYAHAQSGSDVQLLTDNFHANDRPQVPDPSQISYVTPVELLKSSSAPVVPDAFLSSFRDSTGGSVSLFARERRAAGPGNHAHV